MYPTALLRTNPETRVIHPRGSDSRASGSGLRALGRVQGLGLQPQEVQP